MVDRRNLIASGVIAEVLLLEQLAIALIINCPP